MKLLVRNKIFALLSLSRFLNTLGAAIYNLVFVVFAASMPQPSLAVGIANLFVFIPSLFTIFVGMKADRTKKKANWLIRIGYLQASLFILIALMTKIPGYLAFSIVCFLNIWQVTYQGITHKPSESITQIMMLFRVVIIFPNSSFL